MNEAVLDELIEDWLARARRGLCLRFPPLLEARYEADTGAARSRTMMFTGLLGFIVAALLYPVLRDGMPDVVVQTQHFYLQGAIPLGLFLSASLVLNPPSLVREGVTLFANVVCICVSMYLVSITRAEFNPLLVAGVTVLMVYSAIGIQLRFWFAALAVALILMTYTLAMRARGGLTTASQHELLFMAICTAAYLLMANWRLERECRRNYLVALREILRRQDLSLRNVELDELARRDQLTGLANRRAYDAWVMSHWAQQAAQGGRLGLVVVDVDRFKAFNDFYGHAAGDRCLQKIALCLREQLRGTSDLVARLGGEEFAILLPGLSEELSADIAERMRAAVQLLELPHPGLGPHGLVSISAGVASQVALLGTSPSSLFDDADSALYQAKLLGRNQVCVATMPLRHDLSSAAAE